MHRGYQLKFVANLNWLFTESAFLTRFKQAKQAGFQGVECLTPYTEKVELIAEQLQQNQLQMVLINAPAGEQRGYASLINDEHRFKASIELAVDYAVRLSCPRIHVLAGNRDNGVPFTEQYQQLINNMRFAADYYKIYNLKLLIEPLNPFDMPDYLIADLAMAERVINDIDRSNVALQFDIFHCQRTQGNILYYLKKYQNIISHIQIASSPYRHEPNLGEINYPWLFAELEKLNYSYWIGCEYRPQKDTLSSLVWFNKMI